MEKINHLILALLIAGSLLVGVAGPAGAAINCSGSGTVTCHGGGSDGPGSGGGYGSSEPANYQTGYDIFSGGSGSGGSGSGGGGGTYCVTISFSGTCHGGGS